MVLENIAYITNFYDICSMIDVANFDVEEAIDGWFYKLEKIINDADIRESFEVNGVKFTIKFNGTLVYPNRTIIDFSIITDYSKQVTLNIDDVTSALKIAVANIEERLENLFNSNAFTKNIPNTYCIYDSNDEVFYVQLYAGQKELNIEYNTLTAKLEYDDIDSIAEGICFEFNN